MYRKNERKGNKNKKSELSEQPGDLTVKTYINWFPGHMAKAMRQVREKLKLVDMVLEIRDARVPLVSGNAALQKDLGQKRCLIVLNKVNLADPQQVKVWEAWFREQGAPFIFVNSFDKTSLKGIVKQAKAMMATKWETFARKGIRHPPLRMMILGVPNTGKSTIINRLTSRKVAATGDRPGVTQSQQWIVLDKDVELLDTPGIMPPKIIGQEQGLWLCAIHAIRDEIVGKEKVAFFIIEHLKSINSPELQERYQIPSLDISVGEILEQIGTRLHCRKQEGELDLLKTAAHILLDFRKGKLGRCCFEPCPRTEV